MSAEKYDGFEIINIPARPADAPQYTFVESPWITHHNGMTGEYYQYHRETGERRDVPHDWWSGPVETKP